MHPSTTWHTMFPFVCWICPRCTKLLPKWIESETLTEAFSVVLCSFDVKMAPSFFFLILIIISLVSAASYWSWFLRAARFLLLSWRKRALIGSSILRVTDISTYLSIYLSVCLSLTFLCITLCTYVICVKKKYYGCECLNPIKHSSSVCKRWLELQNFPKHTRASKRV